METLLRVLVTACIVLLIPKILGGIHVSDFYTSIIVAVVLSLLNMFIKPILILFTLPITLFTLGLFLLVINAIMIQLCDVIVNGFDVQSLWTAFLFSVLLSISQSVVFSVTKLNKN